MAQNRTPRIPNSTPVTPNVAASNPGRDTTTNSSAPQDINAWLTQGRVLPSLTDGLYPVRLLSFTPVTTAPDPAKWYIRLEWQFPDRVVTDNRFLQGANILCSQLVVQCPGLAGLTPVEFLRALLNDTNSLDCWLSHNTASNGQVYRNLNFRPPVVANSDASADDLPTPETF